MKRKMSRRLGPQDTAAGGLLKMPPRGSQSVSEGPQLVPSGAVQVGSHHLWNMSLLTPRPKMSRRLGAQDTAAGGALEVAPGGSPFVREGHPIGASPPLLNTSFLSPRHECSMAGGGRVRRAGGV